MADANSFPLVRGRSMRVTKTDGCCAPAYGPDNSAVTEGFVSVALTANITDAEEISVTNANGKTCVRDPGEPSFQGYNADITFCEVQPCVFSMITGMPVVTDENGDIVGFRMNTAVSLENSGFALEVWMGVPGVACEGDAGAYGYLLLPCLKGGIIGDFTIENGAVTFTVTGASTRDGNGWASGPYPGQLLPTPLDVNDHLYVIFTESAPPALTDGCVSLVPAGFNLDDSADPDVTLTIPRGNADCWDGTVTIDWGDGTSTEDVNSPTATAMHTYTMNGQFEILVSAPSCPTLVFEVVITGV